mgnify:CR=1 FL=1
MIKLLRFHHPGLGARLGCCVEDRVYDLTPSLGSLSAWLQGSVGRVRAAIAALEALAERSGDGIPLAELDNAPDPARLHWLAPVDFQDVWAAGVTYLRSQQARRQEAVDGGDVYARVYSAPRPELFFKAAGAKVVAPRQPVGIRSDAAWSVPEPELALLINPAMEVVGVTVGNDMSSRDIEGANPLYLPQAKIYTASCALGPAFVLEPLDDWLQTSIRMRIQRADQVVFEGQTHTSLIHRRLSNLIDYLGCSNSFPNGVVLLTGTGIVPPNEFSLQAGDVVTIAIEGVGELVNPVIIV